MCTGAVALLAAVAAGAALALVLAALFLTVACVGFVMPNATALALADHAEVAGSASALLGVNQFLVGAVVAPLVGIAGRHRRADGARDALLCLGAALALVTLARPTRSRRVNLEDVTAILRAMSTRASRHRSRPRHCR